MYRAVPAAKFIVGVCGLFAITVTAHAEEYVCRESLGAVTVDDLLVPDNATCHLTGTTIKGSIRVALNARLTAHNVRVVGNVQADNAAQVNVLDGSRVGGSVQVKQGGGANVSDAIVTGDIQYESNVALLQALRNDVGGNVQVFQNRGGVELRSNEIDGNLQCKENVPAPFGGSNVVRGSAEDQCAGLTGAGGGGLELRSLRLSASEVAGCKRVTGTVTLSAPAPAGGVIVALGDTLAAASTPASVPIGAGASSRTFVVTTNAVAGSQSGKVSATLGSKTLTQDLKLRPMGLSSISLSPSKVTGSQPVAGVAKLECSAGPGPITVELGSSNPAVANPVAASIVVPQGLQSAPFDVTTAQVLSRTSVAVTGSANGIGKSRALQVNPAVVASPTSLRFGSLAVGTTSGPLTTKLTNNGTVGVAVSSIGISGTYAGWFAQTNNCPATLPAGGSCTVSVKFSPTAALSRSAKLNIATSGTSSPLSVSLSGTGQ